MSELMNIEVAREMPIATATSRVMTMVLEGELDREEAADICGMLGRLSANGTNELVIDFTDVTHFDYRAVRGLVQRAEEMRVLGGDLKLAGLSPYLHAIFRSAGAHDAFDYFAESDDAVRSFERGVLVYG
ncbi:MAG: STAS domain-containing protein [Archangium sp.]